MQKSCYLFVQGGNQIIKRMEHETSKRENSQPLFHVILRVELAHTNMLKGHERRLLSLKSAPFLQACM